MRIYVKTDNKKRAWEIVAIDWRNKIKTQYLGFDTFKAFPTVLSYAVELFKKI